MDRKGPKEPELLKELLEIPGVGPKIACDLWDLGLRAPADLASRNPQELYDSLCSLRGVPVDRCMLYEMRCAVYYANNEQHDPRLLAWWNWKDAS